MGPENWQKGESLFSFVFETCKMKPLRVHFASTCTVRKIDKHIFEINCTAIQGLTDWNFGKLHVAELQLEADPPRQLLGQFRILALHSNVTGSFHLCGR